MLPTYSLSDTVWCIFFESIDENST